MICLKSPKSSEFAIILTNSGQKSLTLFISSCLTTIQLNCKNSENNFFKKLRLRWYSNPQADIAEVTRVSGNLRCSNINGDMHTLLIGECLTEAKSVR